MVVPCGDGNIKVCNLIEQAAMRYKKAIAKVRTGRASRTARRAASSIRSTAPTWRSSPASTGAESRQTSRAFRREAGEVPHHPTGHCKRQGGGGGGISQ